MKDVPRLSRLPLESHQLWKFNAALGKETPDMAVLRKYILGEGLLQKQDVMRVLREFTDMCRQEPNTAIMQEPIFIVGDIHGQFHDLIHMFEKAIDGVHDLNKTSLLFLGDYVDRGRYGVGCVLFLFSLKLNFPKTVTMLRGNHESIAMTEMFTFREEVLEKYNGDESVYEAFMDAFETLQLAAEVN